jgi:hypothetical protein
VNASVPVSRGTWGEFVATARLLTRFAWQQVSVNEKGVKVLVFFFSLRELTMHELRGRVSVFILSFGIADPQVNTAILSPTSTSWSFLVRRTTCSNALAADLSKCPFYYNHSNNSSFNDLNEPLNGQPGSFFFS